MRLGRRRGPPEGRPASAAHRAHPGTLLQRQLHPAGAWRRAPARRPAVNPHGDGKNGPRVGADSKSVRRIGSNPAAAVLQSGAEWASVAQAVDPGTGVVRLLPPRHSGPDFSSLPQPFGISRSVRAQPRLQGPAHDPGRWRAPLSEGSFSSPGSTPASRSSRRVVMTTGAQRFLADLNRLGRKGRMMYRRFNASAQDESLDSAGRVRLAGHLIDHAGLEGACMVVGVGDHLEVWNPTAGPSITPSSTRPSGWPRSSPTSPERLERDGHTDLHADRARPSPGSRAGRARRPGAGGDGRRLHLRRRRARPPRRGADRPAGTLVCDRSRPGRPAARFAELAAELVSGSRLSPATSPPRSAGSPPRASAPTPSSRWTSASPPTSSTAGSAGSPTPTTRRSTCGWTRPRSSRRARSSTSGPPTASRPPCEARRGAPRALDRREIVRRRPLETTGELVEAIRSAVPPAYRFGRGHPAKRTFQAIRIAVNAELDSLDRALPAAWERCCRGRAPGGDLLPLARGPPGEALLRRARPRLHLPARVPGLPSAARARGRAAVPAGGAPPRGRGRAQPALALGAPARGAEAARRRK